MNNITNFFKSLVTVTEAICNFLISTDESGNESVKYDSLGIETPPTEGDEKAVSVVTDLIKTVKTVVSIIVSILAVLSSVKLGYESVKNTLLGNDESEIALE